MCGCEIYGVLLGNGTSGNVRDLEYDALIYYSSFDINFGGLSIKIINRCCVS